jgi:glyoxylase-like metal-dependent hydrolase (beta-lactamase superfamily II)
MPHRRVTIDSDVTPQFTACYLRLAGDECAFIEAHTSHARPRLLAALAEHGARPEEVRWVIVTHAHLDHAAGASALLEACPNATLLCHPRSAKHLTRPENLIEGAKAVYGADRFARLYGEVRPIPAERVRALADGESFPLGDATLTAWDTFGHAFHHFVVDDPATESVFTGDAFGLVYPALQSHGRFAIPSTSPTGFHAELAKKSLAKVRSLERRFVCPTHFDAWSDADVIASQLARFLDRAEAWVVAGASSAAPLEALTAEFQREWAKAVREEAPHFGRAELDLLALDIELNAQGLAHAALAMRRASV